MTDSLSAPDGTASSGIAFTRFVSLYTVPKRSHFGVIRLAMRVTLEGTSTAYASAFCSKTILEVLRLRLQYLPAARLSAPAFSSSFPSLWAPLYAYLPSMRTRPDPRWCRSDRPKTMSITGPLLVAPELRAFETTLSTSST